MKHVQNHSHCSAGTQMGSRLSPGNIQKILSTGTESKGDEEQEQGTRTQQEHQTI